MREYVEIKMTVEEVLNSIHALMSAYTCVTGFADSLEVARNVITPLKEIRAQYVEKSKQMNEQQLAEILNEEITVKLCKITQQELEAADAKGIIVLNPVFISKIIHLIT